jgi:hypothetical protein
MSPFPQILWAGALVVTVTVSDGQLTDSRTFPDTVTDPRALAAKQCPHPAARTADCLGAALPKKPRQPSAGFPGETLAGGG